MRLHDFVMDFFSNFKGQCIQGARYVFGIDPSTLWEVLFCRWLVHLSYPPYLSTQPFRVLLSLPVKCMGAPLLGPCHSTFFSKKVPLLLELPVRNHCVFSGRGKANQSEASQDSETARRQFRGNSKRTVGVTSTIAKTMIGSPVLFHL